MDTSPVSFYTQYNGSTEEMSTASLTDAALDEILADFDLAEEAEPAEREALAAASTELTANTIIDRHMGAAGTAAEALKTWETGEFRKLKDCPFSTSPLVKGRMCSVLVSKNRRKLLVSCYDPTHGHSDANLKTDKNGNDYWRWEYQPGGPSARTIVNKDDDLTLALDFKALLHSQHGALAVDPTGELRHYVSWNQLMHGTPPGAGTWRLLSSDYLKKCLADRMSMIVKPFTKKGGVIEYESIRVNQRDIDNVFKMFMIRMRDAERVYLTKNFPKKVASTRFDLRAGIVTRGALIQQDGNTRFATPGDHVLEEMSLDVATDCPKERYAEWMTYLETMLPAEEIEVLGMWLGAVVTGVSTSRLQKAVFLYGTPGNGKSTLGKFLSSIIPEKSRSSLSLPQLSEQFTPAQLYGKLLNFFAESNEDVEKKLDVGRLKVLFDASKLTVENKYQRAFTIEASCGHLFCANILPKVGAEKAIFQRLIVLTVKAPSVRGTAGDNNLFFKDHEERWAPAILAFALNGLKALHARNFRLPFVQSIADAVNKWNRTEDSVAEWLSTLPSPGPKDWVQRDLALDHYTAWAAVTKSPMLRGTHFKTRLENANVLFKRNDAERLVNLKLPSSSLDLDDFDLPETNPQLPPVNRPAPTIASLVAGLPPEIRFVLFGKLEDAAKESVDARLLGDSHAIDRIFTAALEKFSNTLKF